MPWVLLIFAGLLEVVWAIGLKASDGFSRFWPSVVTVIALIGSVVLLGWAARSLPIGTAYAVWTGIGAAGAVIFGMAYFHDPVSAARLFFVAMILGGVVGLKFT